MKCCDLDVGRIKMKKEDCIIGIRVVYSRGIRIPLIGKVGSIKNFHPYDTEIVMVQFDGYENIEFPIHIANLELAEG